MKLALFIQENHISCFGTGLSGLWERKNIKGEAATLIPSGRHGVFAQVLAELSEQLNQESRLRGADVFVLFAQTDVATLAHIPAAMQQEQCTTWQVVQLEPVLQRAKASNPGRSAPKKPFHTLPDASEAGQTSADVWVCSCLLPLVTSLLTAPALDVASPANAKPGTPKLDVEPIIATPAQQLQTTQAEVTQLHSRIRELEHAQHQLQQALESSRNDNQPRDMAQLIIFLPAMYRNFWGAMRPDEIAMLAGTTQVPNIPSPQHDPSPDVVVALKRKFQKLPASDRQRLQFFCREHLGHLALRPEWRDVMQEA